MLDTFTILGISLICNVFIENIVGDVDIQHATRFGLSVVPFFAFYRGLLYLAAEVSWQGPGLIFFVAAYHLSFIGSRVAQRPIQDTVLLPIVRGDDPSAIQPFPF